MTTYSIVVPFFNAEVYLLECLQSIISQSYQNWELLLINDGSFDKSEDICKLFLNNKRIHYYKEKNSGVSTARNFGISKSVGEYIFCMDADDTIDKNFLLTSTEILKKNPCDVLVLGNHFSKRMPIPTALPTWGYLIKNSFFKKHPDVRYPVGIQPAEDGIFSHMLLALTDQIAINKNCQYFYRIHKDQNRNNLKNKKIIQDIQKYLTLLEDFYTKHSLWKKKSFHLLQFLEHEPFALRYEEMNFSIDEKKQLFKLLHNFIKKHHLDSYENETSFRFKLFIKANNVWQYELRKDLILFFKNTLLLTIKIIPIPRLRKKLKIKVKNLFLFKSI